MIMFHHQLISIPSNYIIIFISNFYTSIKLQAIVGRIPYWGCKSNLCGADLEGGGASNLTGADRGRMWIGANVDWGGAR